MVREHGSGMKRARRPVENFRFLGKVSTFDTGQLFYHSISGTNGITKTEKTKEKKSTQCVPLRPNYQG